MRTIKCPRPVRQWNRWGTLLCAAVISASLSRLASGQIATALILEGQQLPGAPAGTLVTAINASATNQVGGFAVQVNSSTMSYVWGDPSGGPGTVLRAEGTFGPYVQASFEGFIGLSNAGQAAYSPILTGGTIPDADSVWLDDSPVAVEGDAHPTLMGQFWSFASRPGVTSAGTPYFVGGITSTSGGATETRGLFWGLSGETVLLLGGQTPPNLPRALATTVNNPGFNYRMSPDGLKLIAPVQMISPTADDMCILLNGSGLMLDGALVQESQSVPASIGGQSGENWQSFDYMGVSNSGSYFFTGDTSLTTTADEFILKNGQILYRDGMTLDGVTVQGEIEAATMNENADLAFMWDVSGNTLEALFWNDQLLLVEGDSVDLDGDGIAESGSTISDFSGFDLISMSAREADGRLDIYFVADVDINGTPSTADDVQGFFRFTIGDCNGNAVPDGDDIAEGTSADCDLDGTPDECQPDCDSNGIPDECEGTLCGGCCGDFGISRCQILTEAACNLVSGSRYLGDEIACPSPPVISQQPQSASTCPGQDAVFTIVVEGAMGTAHYAWSRNGQAVGTDQPTLTLNQVPIDWNGSQIACQVTDDCNRIQSQTVHLQVQGISCALGDQFFDETGETKPVSLTITNPCGTVVEGSWEITGQGQAYSLTPASGMFSIAPGGTYNQSLSVTNLQAHGPRVFLATTVTPSQGDPCSDTGIMSFAPPRIERLDGRYSRRSRSGQDEKRAAYLFGRRINYPFGGERFTATIDWRGHEPGAVEFITPSGTFLSPTDTDTAIFDCDIGDGFPVGSVLRARPITFDGTPPQNELVANFRVVNEPIPLPPLILTHQRNYLNELKYTTPAAAVSTSEGPGTNLPDSAFPGALPGQGGQPLQTKINATGKLEVSGTNQVATLSGAVGGSLNNINQQSLGKFLFGKNISRGFTMQMRWGLPADNNQWRFDGGTLGVTITPLSYSCPPVPFRFVIPTPFVGIPAYWKVNLGIAGEASFGVTGYSGVDQMMLAGSLTVIPSVEAVLGVLDPSFGVEGYLGGGARVGIRHPVPAGHQGLRQLDVFGRGGVRLNVWIFSFTIGSFECTYAFFCDENCFNCTIGFGGRGSTGTWEPMSRDYLMNDFAVFFGDEFDSRGAGPTDEATLVMNEFPFASPELARSGPDLVAVWLTDDTARGDLDRTQAVFSRRTGGTWSTPVPIADDGTADFEPQIAGLAGGNALAAWNNLREPLPTGSDPNSILPDMEIAAAIFSSASGTWGPQANLTSNGYLDHLPRLAASADGTAILVWIANLDNDLHGSAAHPNQIMFSRYDGVAWSAPAPAAGGIGALVSLGVAYEGAEAAVLYVEDLDADFASAGDTELFALTFDGINWSSPQQLTNDTIPDVSPQVIYATDGELLFVWNRAGNLVSARSFSLADLATAVTLEGENGGAVDFTLSAGDDGRLALVWPDGSTDLADLFYAFYDAGHNLWSAPRQLLHDQDDERDVSAVFDAGGNLVAAYRKPRLTHHSESLTWQNETYDIEVPSVERTDLNIVTHVFDGDLGTSDETLSFDPPNPVPGENAMITATVTNVGDLIAENIAVAFYDGDPGGSGTLIGTQSVAGPLAGGQTAQVQVAWAIPSSTQPREVFVVVDPAMQQTDADRSNNVASKLALGPDLVVQELWMDNPSPCSRRIFLTTHNAGAVPAGAFDVTLRQGTADGPELTTFSLTGLQPDEVSSPLEFLYAAPDVDSNGTVLIYANVDEDNSVVEFSDLDNTRIALVDLHSDTASDCNSNSIVDECETLLGLSPDCDSNGRPDECDPDCNTNGHADPCDIAGGVSTDGNNDGVPDECEGTGDSDGDGDVDGADFIEFADCLHGPSVPPNPVQTTVQVCLRYFDYDFDADVDFADFEDFQSDYTGP